MAFTRPDNDKSIWRTKPDVIQGSATTVKADFDKLLNDNTDDLITVIGELEAATGAASLGAKNTADATITVQGHISNVANPHGVTNAQVGLGNVTNNEQATKIEFTSHTGNTTNPHSVTKAQVGLGSVDNTADADKPLSTAAVTALGGKVDKVTGKSLVSDTEITKLAGIAEGAEANVNADWNAASGDAQILNKPTLGTAAAANTGTTSGTVPILDANGKLVTSVIPSTAITSVSVAATEAAMLALDVEAGEVCIRSDENKSYILQTAPASTIENWILLATPTDAVLSVCGKTGTITLTADDVSALDASDIENSLASTSTTKALSAAQGKALADVIGTFASINAWFTGKSADTLVKCLNALITQIGTTAFDSWFGSLADFSTCINLLATNKVTSSDISAVRYDSGSSKFQYTLDDENWVDLTGAQGIQGKGYNPRGDWVSGGSYVNNTTTIDTATYNGTSYYCKVSTSGTTAPSADTTNWGILATSGTIATGADVILTGYAKAESEGAVASTDTVNVGIGKLEKNMDGKAASSHEHVTDDITDFPTSMTPTAHNHAASDINSGTLTVAQGGTGAATLTSGAILKGAGTSAITTATEGTDYCGIDPNNAGAINPLRSAAVTRSGTDSLTLALVHSGCLLYMSNAGAAVVTIPLNSAVDFPVGSEIEILRGGAGAVTITPASGVTIYCKDAARTIADRWSTCCLKQISTNEWLLQGNMG